MAAQNRNSSKVLDVPEFLGFLGNSGILKEGTIVIVSSLDDIRRIGTSPARLIQDLKNLLMPQQKQP